MSILAPLGRAFTRKPLVVGGRAMEHYGLRPSGPDIDLVLAFDDFVAVVHEHPGRLKDLWGDLGVCVGQYELWKTICLLSYADLVDGAVDLGDVLVISLEKLLLMKALAMTKEKYLADTRLVAARLLQDQARGYARVGAENAELLRDIPGVAYVEHRGPGASSPSNVIATSHGIPRRNVAGSPPSPPPASPILLRRALPEDLPAVRALFLELNEHHAALLPAMWRVPDPPEPDDEDYLTSIANERCFFAVADDSGEVVGFVDASHHEPQHPSDPDRPWCRINNVAVRHDRRRQGIGALLVRAAEQWAASRGYQDIRLDVFAANAEAASFYASLGYATLVHQLVKHIAFVVERA
jgi:GNAT superfamily N-acetyltransferase